MKKIEFNLRKISAEYSDPDRKELLILFVYYAGHGASYEGSTEMITTDDYHFPIESLIYDLASNSFNIITGFLDCCRDKIT